MRFAPVAFAAVFLTAAACHHSSSPGLVLGATTSADASTTAADIALDELDAGFVSAASELVPVLRDGGTRAAAGAQPRGLTAGGASKAASIEISGGVFASGSTPGDEGRDPALEPARVSVTLGVYAIDALPYPNDPSAAPRLVASVDEAAQLCRSASASAGGRLCTELEWEHACAGPDSEPFSTGTSWNSLCDKSPSRCASAFDVRAMGFMPEWTDGPFVRGATPHGPGHKDVPHRCAARVNPTVRSAGAKPGGDSRIGQAAFRCCHGERNGAEVAPVEARPAFRRANLDAEDLARVFAEVPELSQLRIPIREGVHLFTDAELKSGIIDRAASPPEGITFSTAPIVWSPSPGIELLVATGRAKKTSFVVALWTWGGAKEKETDGDVPSDRDRDKPTASYRFASSFILLNDPAPVALAWEPARRKSLLWTSCFGCTGEQGAVSLRDDGRVVVVQY